MRTSRDMEVYGQCQGTVVCVICVFACVCMHVCALVCVCARREEDPISTTLKVITLIKAVMCADRGGRVGEEGEGRGEPAIFYGAV